VLTEDDPEFSAALCKHDGLSNLARRSVPGSRNDFLRCQLGRYLSENRRVRWRSTGGQFLEITIPVTVFLLVGFGSTWGAAAEMAMQRLGLVPMPSIFGLSNN
jgi:hypothetical protein